MATVTRSSIARATAALLTGASLLAAAPAATAGESAHAKASSQAAHRAAPSPTRLGLGSNLGGINDWSGEYPFIDVFKTSRAWISSSSAPGAPWDDGRAINVDSHGWVKSLLPDQIVRTIMLTNDYAVYPSGRYIVRYDGRGTLAYDGGAHKVDSASRAGREVVDYTAGQGTAFFLNITSTDATNPLRNIKVIAPGGRCGTSAFSYAASAKACKTKADYHSFESLRDQVTFHPIFLQRLRHYRVLRFMDWMNTDLTTIKHWGDRPRVDDARWSENGVPGSVMVNLANLLNVDPWFNMPHEADNQYMTKFASSVAAKLEPGRRAFVEYSNEVWNWQFAQAHYALDRSRELGLGDGGGEDYLRFYSLRSQQMFDLWKQAFGGTSRIVRVMAAQAGNSWVAQHELEFRKAAVKADALAIAPYFGEVPPDQASADAAVALGVDAYFTKIFNTYLPESRGYIQANKAVARQFGLPLIAYEGGQHFTAGVAVQHDAALDAFFDQINRDPRMGDAYRQSLKDWQANGGGLFINFTHCAGWSDFGRWGVLEYPTQPRSQAPKYDAIMDWAAKLGQ